MAAVIFHFAGENIKTVQGSSVVKIENRGGAGIITAVIQTKDMFFIGDSADVFDPGTVRFDETQAKANILNNSPEIYFSGEGTASVFLNIRVQLDGKKTQHASMITPATPKKRGVKKAAKKKK